MWSVVPAPWTRAKTHSESLGVAYIFYKISQDRFTMFGVRHFRMKLYAEKVLIEISEGSY